MTISIALMVNMANGQYPTKCYALLLYGRFSAVSYSLTRNYISQTLLVSKNQMFSSHQWADMTFVTFIMECLKNKC